MSEKSGLEIFVNYCDRNKVKALGCKWNPNEKEWYCPLGINKENLDGLIALQNKRLIGFIKEIHSRSEYNSNKGYIDIGYQYTGLCEPYTEEEIREYYDMKPNTNSFYKFGKSK